MRSFLRGSLTVGSLWLAVAPAAAIVVIDSDFDVDEDGFVYVDDSFRNTSQPDYASGNWDASDGFEGGGGLSVTLGGVDGNVISGISGGWRRSFSLAAAEELEIRLLYNLTETDYENNEFGQVLLTLDGQQVGAGGESFIAEIKGNGGAGGMGPRSTDWRLARIDLGTLDAGAHTITVGGYNNRKSQVTEVLEIRIDELRLASPEPANPDLSAQAIVDDLDPAGFEQNVFLLESFVSRHWSQPGNISAGDWIEAKLASYGYVVERHTYPFGGEFRDNVYATKVGTLHPDRMYIVSAHMDSINTESAGSVFAPGADDDASGTSLVLEAARVFAPATVETETSVRFVLWNNEETGLDGSEAYVTDRRDLQGIEDPPGSGVYPEPTWLGVIQHDMILFDHGLPPGADQIPEADIDVEYQAGAGFVGGAIELVMALYESNLIHAPDYPAQMGTDMNWTDSKSFQNDCPAVSVRENRRVSEIGNGANPHWHKDSDVVATYSPEDFLLGFNTAQTTVGAVARLAGATVVICGDGIVPPAEGCDDGGTAPGDGCDGDCEIEPGWTCVGEPSSCALCRTSNLGFPNPHDLDTISWDAPNPAVCASLYDVAKGDLDSLRSSGSFASAICLEDDTDQTQSGDTTVPPSGTGLWYLSRVDGDSWQSAVGGTPDRDLTLTACP